MTRDRKRGPEFDVLLGCHPEKADGFIIGENGRRTLVRVFGSAELRSVLLHPEKEFLGPRDLRTLREFPDRELAAELLEHALKPADVRQLRIGAELASLCRMSREDFAAALSASRDATEPVFGPNLTAELHKGGRDAAARFLFALVKKAEASVVIWVTNAGTPRPGILARSVRDAIAVGLARSLDTAVGVARCATCGKTFERVLRKQLWCSKPCQAEAIARRKREERLAWRAPYLEPADYRPQIEAKNRK